MVSGKWSRSSVHHVNKCATEHNPSNKHKPNTQLLTELISDFTLSLRNYLSFSFFDKRHEQLERFEGVTQSQKSGKYSAIQTFYAKVAST